MAIADDINVFPSPFITDITRILLFSFEKLIAETSKISKHIQWQPKYNDLEEIINSSIKWEEKINARNS